MLVNIKETKVDLHFCSDPHRKKIIFFKFKFVVGFGHCKRN